MSTILVGNASELSAAIAGAKPGDIIRLAAGNYGDVKIKGEIFATDLTITSADVDHPAVLHSLNIINSEGINVLNVSVDYVPDATTLTFSSAVKITDSHDITFKGGEINSGAAVSGVTSDATKLDGTGNVIGLWTARGISIHGASDVVIEGVDISKVFRGITIGASDGVTIRNNNIHDVRTSPIVGADIDNLTIDRNHLSESHPFRWGSIDHADFIHLWTNAPGQTAPTKNLTITNNIIQQGDGEAILGIYLDDQNNNLGFTNATISNNVILNGNGQGIRLEHTFNSTINDNVLLQTSGTSKNSPGVYITDYSHDLNVSGNFGDYFIAAAGSSAGMHDNTLVQLFDANGDGYYTASLVGRVEALADAVSILDAVSSSFGVDGNAVGIKLSARSDGDYVLVGAAGDDTLLGLGGNDTLLGGGGDDLVSGGGGSDLLAGGLGADEFIFDRNYPSTTASDTIIDFSPSQDDELRLHNMAGLVTSGKGFVFIGTQAFHHVAGEVRYSVSIGFSTVQGDLNGDGATDFSIHLPGVSKLTASDFLF